MNIRILRKPAESSQIIDISDYILSISGLEWRRKRDYTIVIPHPKITCSDSLEIEIDDYIYFEFDGIIRLKTFIKEIRNNYEKKINILSLNDMIKKLENYYIGNFSETDWDGYTCSDSEYMNDPDYNYKYYIQVLFFIKVAFHKALGIDINNVISLEIENMDSGYKYKNNNGDIVALEIKDLYFYFPQLLSINKSSDRDDATKTSKMLDVLLLILSILRIRYEYQGNYILLKPYIYGNENDPSFNDDDIFKYDKQPKDGYNAVEGKLERLTTETLGFYPANWNFAEIINEEYEHANDLLLPKKTYQFPKHFEIHRIHTGFGIMPFDPDSLPFTDYAEPYYTFLEQFVDRQYEILFGSREKFEITTTIQYNLEFLVNRFNIQRKNLSSDITYLKEE